MINLSKAYLWIKYLFCYLFFLSASSSCKIFTVKYLQKDNKYEYRVNLLKLALNKTRLPDEEISIELIDSPDVTQARLLTFLEQNKINIVFLPTTKEREEKYLPIKIDILKGIIGYRILLIHKDNEAKFSSINSLDILREHFTAGFGSHWADMEILEANRLKITGVVNTKNLFTMLENKRFDYFPRGINEIWQEIENQKPIHPNLTIEKSIALYYPYAVYYFVNKNNIKLSKRIEKWLLLALEDGSFKKLFMSYHKDFLQKANLKNRRLFKLNNPTLPANTPKIDTSWWLEEK